MHARRVAHHPARELLRRSDGATWRSRWTTALVPVALLAIALALPAIASVSSARPGIATAAAIAAEVDPEATLVAELAAAAAYEGFIVVLREPTLADRMVALVTGGRRGDVIARAEARIAALGGRITATLDGAVLAVVAELPVEAARSLVQDRSVRWVSPNVVGGIDARRTATTVSHAGDVTLLWGLSVLDSDPDDWGGSGVDYQAALDRTYRASSDGDGVDVFVVDTGIRSDHPELAGRVRRDADFAGGLHRRVGDTVEPDADCNGHGTHVAGTIAGLRTGVAPGAHVVPVKVTLDCTSTLTAADIIAGLDWIAAAVAADPTRAYVVNMSVGLTSVSSALDAAVEAIVGAPSGSGVPVVVAAGNSDVAASTVSPARVASAITVGALGNTGTTFRHDQRWVGSNHGASVDLLAPGTLVHSACVEPNRLAGSTGSETTRACTASVINGEAVDVTALTGTSMAAPHVAGVTARHLGASLAVSGVLLTPMQVRTALVEGALAGIIDESIVSLSGAPDLVLNTMFLEPAPTEIAMPSVLACSQGAASALVQLPTGGIGPLTWAITDGALPVGLTMASNGQLSGSAANAASAPGDVTIRVTDVFGRTVSGTFAARSFTAGC